MYNSIQFEANALETTKNIIPSFKLQLILHNIT